MNFFTYQFYKNGHLLRIGKGYSSDKTGQGVVCYITKRYGREVWDEADFQWRYSESAALKMETKQLDEYVETYGALPPLNRVRGGGGRQVHLKCKAYKSNVGRFCINDALASNYGYCGVHR